MSLVGSVCVAYQDYFYSVEDKFQICMNFIIMVSI